MIAIDTNALVRLAVEDDREQAKAVQELVLYAEKGSIQVIVVSEVLVELVWVLETVYACTRSEICEFLETLASTAPFSLMDSDIVRDAVKQYRKKGDFADLVIIGQAKKQQAKKMFSFDKDLQKIFPGYVVADVNSLM